MHSRDLTCAEAVELMTDYAEGGLSPGERERFEHHLARCTGCDNYLDELQTTVATAHRLAEDGLPERVRDDLRRAFRGWRQGA